MFLLFILNCSFYIKLACYVPGLPGYYTCCTRGIVSDVYVNKDLIIENNLFIYNT